MKAFITGSTGFLGRHIVNHLVSSGWDVVCLVRNPNKIKYLPKTVKIAEGDITQKDSLKKEYFADVDVVFHLAALLYSKSKKNYQLVNYRGTRNLVEVILSANENIKRFVFTSSLAAHGPTKLNGDNIIKEDDPLNPVTSYGESKKMAEEFLQSIKNILPVVIIRPTIIYGPFDFSLLNLFRFSFKYGFPIIPETILSVVYVYDVVKLHLLSATDNKIESGETFLISDGNKYTFADIHSIINSVSIEMFGKKIRKINIPNYTLPIFEKLLYPLQFVLPDSIPLSPQRIKEIKAKNWFCSYQKAKKLLGFEPSFTAYEGLKETFFWYSSENLF